MENIKGQWNFISSKKLERMRGEKKIGTVSFVMVMIGVEFFREILFSFLLLFLVLFPFFFRRGTLPNRILQDNSSVIGIVVDVQTDSSMNLRFLWSITFAMPEQFKAESSLSSVKPWKTRKYYSPTDLRPWTVAHGLAELSEETDICSFQPRVVLYIDPSFSPFRSIF